ncbi:HEPN domain-containing protein [Candidatus Woesearchaeota archaeon]|nr:HEPN domain-containing protein [Candidatus Woesearchaeota archaeon]
MNEFHLKKILIHKEELDKKIETYEREEQISKVQEDKDEINGHLEKAEHNLKFVEHTSKTDFSDWVLVGCYYTLYHAALALLLNKGFFSKNHDATLCLLIRHYYKEISPEEIELINFSFLNQEDFLFYAESKNKREDASYTTKIKFEKAETNKIIINTRLLFNKAKTIIMED